MGRNLAALEATRDKCLVAGGCSRENILIIKCDLRSERECEEAVRKTTHFYGGLRNLSTEIILKLKVRKDKFCHRIFGLRAGCSDKLC